MTLKISSQIEHTRGVLECTSLLGREIYVNWAVDTVCPRDDDSFHELSYYSHSIRKLAYDVEYFEDSTMFYTPDREEGEIVSIGHRST